MGEDFESPVHEMMQNSSFYECTSVSKSRKTKWCELCGDTIPIGSASNGAKLFNDVFYQVDFCSSCEETYESELYAMQTGSLDGY